MAQSTEPVAEGKTRRVIVKLLKMEGALDSARLAERLRLTAMAVRQHLYALQDEKLVTAEPALGPSLDAAEFAMQMLQFPYRAVFGDRTLAGGSPSDLRSGACRWY